MTTAEVMKLVEAGHAMMICEYRTTKIDHIKWTDKATGRKMEAALCRHTVENCEGSIVVGERIPDGTTDFKPYMERFKKGQRVAIQVGGLTVEKGAVTLDRSVMHPMEVGK